MEPLEWKVLRPRQVRYQAALRPDCDSTSIVRHLRRRPDATGLGVSGSPTGYWKYGFTPAGSGVLSSATIIDEI
jgi:hypothetical protein